MTRTRGVETVVVGETFEELGRKKEGSIDCEITWELTPGERMVMYYPDGSGYPGSPPEAEAVAVRITRVEWADHEVTDSDWLRHMEEYVWSRIEKDFEDLKDHAFDQVSEWNWDCRGHQN